MKSSFLCLKTVFFPALLSCQIKKNPLEDFTCDKSAHVLGVNRNNPIHFPPVMMMMLMMPFVSLITNVSDFSIFAYMQVNNLTRGCIKRSTRGQQQTKFHLDFTYILKEDIDCSFIIFFKFTIVNSSPHAPGLPPLFH